MHAKSLQLYQTLCDSMDSSLPGSSVYGIFRARILEWVARPSSRFFPTQGLNLHLLHCQLGSFNTSTSKDLDPYLSVASSEFVWVFTGPPCSLMILILQHITKEASFLCRALHLSLLQLSTRENTLIWP